MSGQAVSRGMRSGTLAWLGPILADESLDPTETLLMIGLADHVDEHDECFVGIGTLAKYARVSYGTARRRLASLEKAGHLERSRRRRDDGNMSTYLWRMVRPVNWDRPPEPARNLRDGQRAPRSAVTSAHPDARAEVPSMEVPSTSAPNGAGHLPGMSPAPTRPPTAEQVLKARAHKVATAVFERKVPAPASKFVAVMGIAKLLLVAGWADDAVIGAMVASPTITTNSIEFQLNRVRPSNAPTEVIEH